MDLECYDGKCVRITTVWGEIFEGVVSYDDKEYAFHEYGREEEALHLVPILFFENEYNIYFRKYYLQNKKGVWVMLDRIALILVTIGALNWGSIGLFKFDLVAWLFGGQAAIMSRIVYVIVALAGIWCISLLFRENEMVGTVMADDTTNE